MAGWSRNLAKSGLCALLWCGAALAQSDSTDDRIGRIENTLSQTSSKAGISFGGEFNSQFLLSTLKGNAVQKTFRKDESVEFTSVDFDILARPNTALAGRAMFRMYADWRNMWASFKEPIALRWISIDGMAKNVVSWNIGDFRQRYSPLTLWSPDVGISFEPEIFSKQRVLAQNEMFLGNNDRILQGVNINFDAEISPVLKEAHLNVLGSRLRTAGAAGPGQVPDLLDTINMDKYLIGANLDAVVKPGLSIGGSFLNVFDVAATYGGSETAGDSLAKNTRIAAGRATLGNALFMDAQKTTISVDGEVAFSMDDTTTTQRISPTVARVTTESIVDMALSADLKGTFALGGKSSLAFSAGYLNSGVDYRNELAQSPTLLPVRVMNSENDPATAALFSTYDALYRQVFKFAPSQNAANAGAAAGWLKGPMSKIGYTNGIFTRSEMQGIPLDPALFLVMPYGPATPNRSGIKAKLDADLQNRAVHLSGSMKMVNELEGMAATVDTTANTIRTLPETAFLEAGGGASVNCAAFGHWWAHPCIVSGSYTLSSAVNDGVAGFAASSASTTVGFLNTGLYWTLVKRISLLGGLQMITMTTDGLLDNKERTTTQSHIAGGLEYKVSGGGTVTGSFGLVDVAHAENPVADFRQWQTDLFLTVRF